MGKYPNCPRQIQTAINRMLGIYGYALKVVA